MAGQTIRTLRQVKTLTIVLLASTILTVIYTGWQYTAGVGVQATGRDAVLASLRHFGIVPGDIIREVKGRPTRTSTQLLAQLDGPESSVKIVIWRETPDALQTFVSNVAPKDFKSALQHSDIELVRAHPPRAQGFYKHYFAFAGVLALVALLVLGIATSSTLRPRVALLAIFLGIVATLGLTLTRSYLASVIFGALVVVLIQSRRRTGWITAAAFVVLALAGLYTIQRHRVPPASDASDPGTAYRFEMWRDSLPLIKAHPWFGVGLDSVAGDWQKWNLEAYRRFPLHSHFHSTPIQIAVECGLPALAVWMWLLVAYGLYLLRLQRALSGQHTFARGLTLGVLGGLIVFVLSGFLQYNFGDAEVMVVFWLSMGLVFALDRLAGKRDASHAGLPSLTAALQTF
jgi:branched-subunit amino acid transport protein